ncbi:MAG: AsmA family protein [Betaproteobacteria bacterium]|nr:AsmA family protein [Betaproteobacteria bacterium]
MIDGAFVKSRLERHMKEEKQRTLKIEGTPALKLFPVFSLSLGKTSLSEPKSDKVFVSLDTMEVAVRVMPLLSRELSVEALSLTGLKANIVRDKDGRMNFADLAGKKDEKPDAGGEPPKLRLAGAKIERANIAYADQASGQVVTITDLTLTTGKLEDDTPAPISLSMSITGRKPDLALKVQAGGSASVNLAKHVYAVDALALQVKGTLERDALAAALNAPKLRVTPAKAEGQAITANLSVKGPGRNVEAKLAIAAVEGSASALSIPSLTMDIDSNVSGNGMKGRVSTPVKANLQARTWELPKIDANLTFSGPAVPQKSVTLPILASLLADLAKQSVSAELATKFDETGIKAKFGATRLEPLVATFDVAIDKLNLDRYIHPDKQDAKADEKIDLSALKGKTVSGKFTAGALTVKRVKLENVKAEIKLANGKLDVAPHSAGLYGGTLSGAVSADANGNRFAVKESIQNVALGALLRDAAQKDVLDGRGNVDIDLQTVGTTVPALKKALVGGARVVMKEGAVKGINLAESFRNVKGALGSKSVQSDTKKQTDFSDMSASFAIKNGVAHNEDLKAAAPFARLGGAGDIDIGNNAINYTAKVSLVATSKGQGGKAAGEVAGVTVPVKITGSLDNPSWSIDYTALAGSALGGVLGGAGAVGGAVGDAAKKGTGAVTDAVRGLFGRK